MTLTDMKDTLRKANKTYCERDPFSISDIKEQHNLDKLTLVFHGITNRSLKKGIFPKTEKEASVRPTLKSVKDQQRIESFRPI